MKNELGLVHIYCGEGKGKTTAAMGLALRALGHGLRVAIVQFLKDGGSGEIRALSGMTGLKVFANSGLPSFSLNEDEERLCRSGHRENFMQACALCADGECDLLILDEVVGAIKRGLFSETDLLDWLKTRPKNVEVVLTGRKPSLALLDLADYVSRIEKIKHPYNKGITARIGVEK